MNITITYYMHLIYITVSPMLIQLPEIYLQDGQQGLLNKQKANSQSQLKYFIINLNKVLSLKNH